MLTGFCSSISQALPRFGSDVLSSLEGSGLVILYRGRPWRLSLSSLIVVKSREGIVCTIPSLWRGGTNPPHPLVHLQPNYLLSPRIRPSSTLTLPQLSVRQSGQVPRSLSMMMTSKASSSHDYPDFFPSLTILGTL
jgi:hypothetical protein